MHESSIIEYTLKAVEGAALRNDMKKVTEINLVIGKLRVAIPRMLHISFDLLTSDTMFAGCKLNIEERDVVIHCEDCGKDTVVQDLHIDTAPCCGSRRVRVLQGNELMISSFKGY